MLLVAGVLLPASRTEALKAKLILLVLPWKPLVAVVGRVSVTRRLSVRPFAVVPGLTVPRFRR